MTSMKNRNLSDDFRYQELKISNIKYVIGVHKMEDKRHIILTNLIDFYDESLPMDDLIKRCKDLNPALIDVNFEEIIDDLLIDIPKFITSATIENIQLEKWIDDGRLWLNIKLKKTDSKFFYQHFVKKFIHSFYELYNGYNYLLDLVKQKDLEIEEYKAQGISLMRKSTETKKFCENTFTTKMENKKPVEIVATFMDMMKYYHSIRNSDVDKKRCVQKSENKTEYNTEETKVILSKKNEKNIMKRPASSTVRCAIAPKINKTNKTNKFLKEYKFL